jgi:hypothetical protein
LVGGDVGDGVGCCGAGIELDWVHRRAVDVGGDAEVEVGLRACDGCAKVGVRGADLDDRRVVAVHLQHRRGRGRISRG